VQLGYTSHRPKIIRAVISLSSGEGNNGRAHKFIISKVDNFPATVVIIRVGRVPSSVVVQTTRKLGLLANHKQRTDSRVKGDFSPCQIIPLISGYHNCPLEG
jgi:hypothetical protein